MQKETPSSLESSDIHPESVNGKKVLYKKLARNVTVAIFCLCIVPGLFAFGIILKQYDDWIQEHIRNDLKATIDRCRMEIDTHLQIKAANIQDLFLMASPEELQRPGVLEKHLNRLRRTHGPALEELGLVSAEGKLVANAGSLPLHGTDYSQTDWFRNAKRQKLTISDVMPELKGTPHLIITARTVDAFKNVWIIRATIDFNVFSDIIKNLKIGKNGFVTIINRSGELQTRSTQNTNQTIELYKKILSSPPLNDALFSHEADDKNGQRQIYVAGFLKNRDWLLIAQQPKSEAFAALDQIRESGIILFLLFGLAMIFLSIFTAKKFGRILCEKAMFQSQQTEKNELVHTRDAARTIARKINSPLAVIVEEAGKLADRLTDEEKNRNGTMAECKKTLKLIHAQGLRCREIVQGFLTFDPEPRIAFKNVQINAVIRTILPFCVSRAKHANVRIETQLGPYLPEIMASTKEIQWMLLSLANIGIDAMEPEGGILSFHTEFRDGFLDIHISNTGPGVPETHLKKFFDSALAPEERETSIELSVCREIIRKIGGMLQVESMAETGTTFRILLPVRKEQKDIRE